MFELLTPIVDTCSSCGSKPSQDRFCDLVQIVVYTIGSSTGTSITLCHDCAHYLIEQLLGRYYALWGQSLMFSDAVTAEREACASLCEYHRDVVNRMISQIGPKEGHEYRQGRASAFDDAATAIRARGDNEQPTD